MEVSNNVSLPSEIVGYVVRVVGQWWARFNDCYTPDIGSGGLIPDMRDDLIDVVQFEPLCGGLMMTLFVSSLDCWIRRLLIACMFWSVPGRIFATCPMKPS